MLNLADIPFMKKFDHVNTIKRPLLPSEIVIAASNFIHVKASKGFCDPIETTNLFTGHQNLILTQEEITADGIDLTNLILSGESLFYGKIDSFEGNKMTVYKQLKNTDKTSTIAEIIIDQYIRSINTEIIFILFI